MMWGSEREREREREREGETKKSVWKAFNYYSKKKKVIARGRVL